jgi:hypothetical protein
VSNRTKYTADYTDQHIGSRNSCGMNNVNCCKIVDYCKEKEDINSSINKCLVEWNDINKTKSWVIFLHQASVILNL